jgi:putative membrane protein
MSEPIYPGIDGFLGTRAALTVDLLVVSMLFVVLVLGWSVYQARYRRRFQLHKRVQLTLAAVLLVTVALFEIDIRLHGWQSRAAGAIGGEPSQAVWYALYVHLVCSLSTVVLWPVVIYLALRHFPSPPRPGAHSRVHVPLARLAAVDMVLTAVTGWVFYWLAFVS